MDRKELKKLAADKRFISGIYNYCDRWCERCPQTSRCLNFSLSEREFSDPETRDIRNEAFWKKLSGILEETFELLKESAEEWGVDLDTLESTDDIRDVKAMRDAAESHLLCRVAKRYTEMVDDWFKEEETLFLQVAAAGRGLDPDEAFEVIRWYQYFISAKMMRAVRGKMEDDDDEERSDEFPSDADGSAKIALIAMDRSIAAWAVIHQCDTHGDERVTGIITFLDRVRQAVEKAFPGARSFVRPGFDGVDLGS